MSPSSNDVIPTCIHIAAAESIRSELMPALDYLQQGLEAKAQEFWDVIKIGRTHLMDATPIRLGQELSGYAKQIEHGKLRAATASPPVEERGWGGPPSGTGLIMTPEFPGKF